MEKVTKVKVSKTSNPKKVASAAVHLLKENEGQPVVLSAIGTTASYILNKTLINLKNFAAQQDMALTFVPQWGLTEIEEAGEFSTVEFVVTAA